MKNKSKFFASIMLLLLLGFGQVWATDYTLAASTFNGDKNVATVDGQVFTFDQAHGGTGQTGYSDYIKLSKNKTYTITLPDGFVLTNINIKGYTNSNGKTNGEITSVGGNAQTGKTFPAKDDANLGTATQITDGYDFAISQTGGTVAITTANTNQICVLITITGTAPACTAPEIEWDDEPVGGEVGGDDFMASVTTTPADHAVTWESSNTSVATVSNGTIHYVAPGTTKITATLNYTGDDYCKTTVSVDKDILVPIPTSELGTNDKRWYFKDAVPGSSPVDGLTFNNGSTSGNGVYGVKLDSKGYAWFAKPAVSGTLRIGAYYKTGGTTAYEVNVYACSSEGEKGDLINALSVACAGSVSEELIIDASVEGIYIIRKTNNEGALYFVEFIADPETPACPSGLTISGTTAYTEGQTIELEAALVAGNGDITYTWYKGASLSAAKSAGSIGTGASFSKASCTTSDAGNYWCEATKADCSAASNASAFAVTVAESSCPKNGVIYSLAMGNITTKKSIAENEYVDLADYATIIGGSAEYGASASGKAEIGTGNPGSLKFGGAAARLKLELDCELRAGDVLSYTSSNTAEVALTTTATRSTTIQTSSLSYTVPAEGGISGTTIYIWQNGSTSYIKTLTITRPYSVSFESAKGSAPATPAKAISFTLEEISGVEGWTHTGWTADKAVEVGGESIAAGTALAVDATVTLSANTVFTAVWKDNAALSTNAYLASLSVAGYALDFNKETTTYTIVLDYGTSTLPEITYEVEDTGLATAVKVEGGVNGATTITVTPEAGAGHEKVYTINFSVSTSPKFVIFDGSTMSDYADSGSDSGTGFAWTVTGGNHSEKSVNTTLNGKTYTKGQNIFGSATKGPNAGNTRYITITIPEGYLAKFYLAGATNSNNNMRSSYISREITGTLDESIAYVSSDQYPGTFMRSDLQLPGTYYYCADNSIRLYELSIQLYEIDYPRELPQGMLSTTCLPNGGVMVGASIYEIAYMDFEADDTTPHKIYFDEVVGGVMEAGMPYVVLVNENSAGMYVVYTDNANKTTGLSHNGLVGYLGATKALDENDYFIYNNLFYYVSDDDALSGRIRISSNRAYIDLSAVPTEAASAPAPGRRRVALGNGNSAPMVATAIDNAQADSLQCTKVLIDGQLFILRGEKMYDVTGRIVK